MFNLPADFTEAPDLSFFFSTSEHRSEGAVCGEPEGSSTRTLPPPAASVRTAPGLRACHHPLLGDTAHGVSKHTPHTHR